jgi:hypothetical protein
MAALRDDQSLMAGAALRYTKTPRRHRLRQILSCHRHDQVMPQDNSFQKRSILDSNGHTKV